MSALGFRTKFSYGIGQGAEGMKTAAFNVFLLFYYVQVLGLPGTYAGIAIGVALIFDAITDPLTGSVSDNWRSRLGRRHPFMYAAAVPLGVAFYLLFAPPDLGRLGLAVWLGTFAVLTRAAMTLYYVPHIALGAELSEDFHERTTVVAYRYFFNYVGYLVLYGLGFLVFFVDTPEFPRGQFDKSQYAPFAACVAVLMAIVVVASALGTQDQIARLPKPEQRGSSVSLAGVIGRMFGELRSALGNRSFRFLFTGVLVIFMMVGIDNALMLHVNTYFWELTSSDNYSFFMVYVLGVLLGSLIARRLNQRFDKKPSIIFGTACWALCQLVPVSLRLAGWFPDNDSDALVPTLIVIRFVQGFGVVQALITFSSMVADVVDEHELKTGKRQEGVFFSAVSFSGKVTSGVGTIVGGLALDLIGWPRGVEIQTAADVSSSTLNWLGLVYGPIVAGFAVVCLYCYTKYDLTRSRHAEIVAELEGARARVTSQVTASASA